MIKIVKKQYLDSDLESFLLELVENFGKGASKKHYFELEEKSLWGTLAELKRDMRAILNDIDELTGVNDTQKKFGCSKEDAEQIIIAHNTKKVCKNCQLKGIECHNCLFVYTDIESNYLFKELKLRGLPLNQIESYKAQLKESFSNYEGCQSYCSHRYRACFNCAVVCESPLERKLLLLLLNKFSDQNIQLQMYIDIEGGIHEEKPTKTILTRPDFYIQQNDKKVCIYADGHTYHERNETQAMRDRNIDRELQKLGFSVLRYTGKEIRENRNLGSEIYQTIYSIK